MPLPPLPLLPPGAAPFFPPMPYWEATPWLPPVLRPRVWTVFVLLVGAFVASQAAGILVIVGAILVELGPEARSPDAIAAAAFEVLSQPPVLLGTFIAIQLVLLAATIVGTIMSPEAFRRRLRLGPSTLPIYGYPLVALGGLAIGVIYSELVNLLGIKDVGALKRIDEAIGQLRGPGIVWAVLVIGILPGICEEWLFRGYTQSRLSRAWGRWGAILVTAFLFGLMHLNLIQSPFAALFGIYLGYVAEKCGSIRPTMLCHMTNNSFMVLIGAFAGHGDEGNSRLSILIATIAGAVLLSSIVYLRFGVCEAKGDDKPAAFEPILPPATV